MLKGLEHRGQWDYPEIRTSRARGARGENGITERHICCINEAGVGKTVGTGVCEQEATSSDSPASDGSARNRKGLCFHPDF